ncbi:MerR family transcriptional regulator [Microbacterium sp. 13-71-7]|jgi:DNA-binding transcriptional MerR regulator|uniref:MerR family transcriptional regulator n=1 Tax=Microbacterium sp. 13-71-7 TaxID=1970399 RepID=UPI000BC831AE|nr:MerR family transcriptional regulator [Microbacterium sp. 13-71-7]OZB86015.1 MAG: MerR family transcriptional regulator [Microbacterium sp. 13-71-7]
MTERRILDAPGVRIGDGLTVGRAADVLGITVRTLHHWDEIALARPSLRSTGGYRLYTTRDLERLQRILLYRELGLGLAAIRALLDDPSAQAPAELRRQRERIRERIARLAQLDTGLERMIAAHERGVLLTPEQQVAVFGPDWDPSWIDGARARWGATPQWAQYAERSAERSAEEWKAIADATADFEQALGAAFDAGLGPGDAAADRLVDRHRAVFSSYFPLSRSMQVCMVRMYAADPGFAAHYDGIRPGLAAWFRTIVDANARAHGIDPDAAAWE